MLVDVGLESGTSKYYAMLNAGGIVAVDQSNTDGKMFWNWGWAKGFSVTSFVFYQRNIIEGIQKKKFHIGDVFSAVI